MVPTEEESSDQEDADSRSSHRGGRREKQNSLIGPMARLTLHLAQQMRQVEAHTRDSYQLPTSSALVSQCVAAGEAYFSKVKELGKGHGLGAPFLFVAQAGLETLKQNSVLLSQVYDQIERQGANEVYSVFTHFQVRTMYDATQSLVKIGYQATSAITLVSLQDAHPSAPSGPQLIAQVRSEVHRTLLQQGAQILLGAAPRGGLERIIQAGLRRK